MINVKIYLFKFNYFNLQGGCRRNNLGSQEQLLELADVLPGQRRIGPHGRPGQSRVLREQDGHHAPDVFVLEQIGFKWSALKPDSRDIVPKYKLV